MKSRLKSQIKRKQLLESTGKQPGAAPKATKGTSLETWKGQGLLAAPAPVAPRAGGQGPGHILELTQSHQEFQGSQP